MNDKAQRCFAITACILIEEIAPSTEGDCEPLIGEQIALVPGASRDNICVHSLDPLTEPMAEEICTVSLGVNSQPKFSNSLGNRFKPLYEPNEAELKMIIELPTEDGIHNDNL